MAREASKAAKTASYMRGVLEMEAQLVEEVVEVCRDYCAKTWAKALNRTGVPADSDLRRAENIFLSEDIREVLAMLPPPVVDLTSNPELLPTTQASLPDAEVSIGARKGKGVQPLIKTKDYKETLTIKDVVSQAKDAEPNSKAGDP